MNPKSGKAGKPVPPAEPQSALEADTADTGEVAKLKAEQSRTQTGKYGSPTVKPYKPPETQQEKEQKRSWIEIKLVDEEDQPVPGEPYQITLPDGSVIEGTLNEEGCARVDGLDPGSCSVTFPNLDRTAWEPKSGGS